MADFGTVVNGVAFEKRERWYDDVFNPLGDLVIALEDLAAPARPDWYTPMGSRDSWLEANLHRDNLEAESLGFPDGPGWFDKVDANWQAAWENLNDLYELHGGAGEPPAQDPTSVVWDNIDSTVNFLADYQNVYLALAVLVAAEEEEEEEEKEEEAAAAAAIAAAVANLAPTRLGTDDVSYLSENEDCQRYFSTTFNKEVITFVPIIHNFYLTNKYFRNINKAFDNTKDRALDILLSTIRNDDNFDNTPDMTRASAAAAIANSTGQDQNEAFNSAARDFILKMLIKTPIDILKGVVELVDPHVALTKIIKVGTGEAFNELAKLLDGPASEINEELTGEDLLKLLLCIVDQGLSAGENALPEPAAGQTGDNFFPRISIDGVDFTGTVSGMLMVPPSPLGLIYLLLELLKNEVTDAVENVDQAGTEAADETEC
jgi:hypothetical protein